MQGFLRLHIKRGILFNKTFSKILLILLSTLSTSTNIRIFAFCHQYQAYVCQHYWQFQGQTMYTLDGYWIPLSIESREC